MSKTTQAARDDQSLANSTRFSIRGAFHNGIANGVRTEYLTCFSARTYGLPYTQLSGESGNGWHFMQINDEYDGAFLQMHRLGNLTDSPTYSPIHSLTNSPVMGRKDSRKDGFAIQIEFTDT